ncbi:MAG TPA: hypothetical protein VIU93_07080 [Gallionellaceae bacterium]
MAARRLKGGICPLPARIGGEDAAIRLPELSTCLKNRFISLDLLEYYGILGRSIVIP